MRGVMVSRAGRTGVVHAWLAFFVHAEGAEAAAPSSPAAAAPAEGEPPAASVPAAAAPAEGEPPAAAPPAAASPVIEFTYRCLGDGCFGRVRSHQCDTIATRALLYAK